VVFTGQPGNSNINKGDEQEEVTSSNHITAQECEVSKLEIEFAEILETLEDGRQSTIDDLKELDLKTAEKFRPSM